MAGTNRTATNDLSWLAELERAPYAFGFHLAMRRLDSSYREYPRLGEATRVAEEVVRLGQDPSLAFAPAAVSGFRPARDGRPGRLTVAFMGLFGPHGPLPLHLTEYARDRIRHAADRTFASFADVFHHRMLLLFHRAWATAQPTALHDRPETSRFGLYLGSLFGLGMKTFVDRDVVPDISKLFLTGRFANLTKNAEGLAAILTDYFDLPIQIEEFVGEWVELADADRWRLGFARETSTLGQSTVLGQRIWQCVDKFRVVVGPLKRVQFQQLLPGSSNLEHMAALVRAYIGRELNWDVRLVLAHGETDQLQLRRSGNLSWNARIGSSRGAPAHDLIVDPHTGATQRSRSRVAA